MESVSRYVYIKGLRFGLYTNMGPTMDGDGLTTSTLLQQVKNKHLLRWEPQFTPQSLSRTGINPSPSRTVLNPALSRTQKKSSRLKDGKNP
jgi:hypothetical protein